MQKQEKRGIVLFMPKPSEKGYYNGLPLALMNAASLIDRGRFEIRIISAQRGRDYKKEISEAVDEKTLLFGVSSMTGYQIKNSIEAIKIARKKNPSIPVVWGGYHCSLMPEETLQSEFADIAIIGQGQRALAELSDALLENKGLGAIRGLGYKSRGKIKINACREPEDINNFPDIDFSLVDVEKHVMIVEGKKYINLWTSYGCPHRCGFCVEPTLSKRRWFGLEAGRVLKQMECLIENQGIEFFGFNDNNFFVDRERVRKICEGIIKKGWKIQWGDANGRTKQLLLYDEKLWALMEKSGCKSILIGAESGSQEALDLIAKDTSPEDTVKLSAIARRHNIDIVFSLMAGIPRYPDYLDKKKADAGVRKEINDILEMMDKSLPEKKYHAILFFVYTPYPGNPLFEISRKCGFNPPKNLEEWAEFEIIANHVPWVSKKNYNKVRLLMDFVFPYACDYYKKKHIRQLGFMHDVF
ncbi:MAG: radical SAM protein, partial [Candidatus ainarchaeum sp.]|nr:radical SAM protein [Candidatus ainarchaeum sp.]